MKQLGMVLVAVALAVAAWWWFTSEMPRRARQREQAAKVAMAQVERANTLYRWRDAEGRLQITDTPPKGRKFERIGRQPDEGIEIHGNRN